MHQYLKEQYPEGETDEVSDSESEKSISVEKQSIENLNMDQPVHLSLR